MQNSIKIFKTKINFIIYLSNQKKSFNSLSQRSNSLCYKPTRSPSKSFLRSFPPLTERNFSDEILRVNRNKLKIYVAYMTEVFFMSFVSHENQITVEIYQLSALGVDHKKRLKHDEKIF